MKIGDIYYEKHTVIGISHRNGEVSETQIEVVKDVIPLSVIEKIKAEIEPKCDRINSLASVLPYTAHREIQELLCEIMDLCKTESEVEDAT